MYTGGDDILDIIYDFVICCIGMFWVNNIYELFVVVEILIYFVLLCGECFVIIMNGGGLVIMVVDVLLECGGKFV